MFKVTADGETKEWESFEVALHDALTRGFGSPDGWTIKKV